MKRLRREAAANIAEAEDAVSRLQSRDEWLVETIANGDPVEAPWHDFVARFRSLSLEARDAGTWIAAHQEAAKTTADPAFRRAMRIFLKRLAGPIRAGDLARCLDGFPARLLEVNSVLGAAALEQGRESEAREHLKAIAGSPAGAVARRLAIRRLVANRALAVTEVLRPAETALQSLEGHESPDPGEAKSAAASVTQAISSARPMIHWLENLGPEAAEGSRDVAAALARRAALLVGRAGGDPVPGLREASGLAGEAELRADIEADLADPSWAVAIAQALYPLRHGGVEHAWRRVRRLRRKADTAARRERLRSLLARPSSFLNPARGRPWSFTAYGSGPGYFGKRPDPADLRLYVASHAWRIFRMPVFTLGAYLFASSDPAAKRPEPKRDHFLGQVPLAFRPSRAKLFAKGGAVMALLLVIAFAGLDFVSNISGYQRLRTICAQGEDADLKSRCSALQDLSDRGSFYVRWKSRRKLAEILLPRVRAIRTYADLYGFVRELGGPEEEWDRGMKFYVRWFPPEMDAAVEECLQRLPPPALPPTGGAWWSVDRIPFEERAVPLGQFVEWACDSSPGIYPRRATFALDAARRLDAPHLWVLAVKYSREYDQIQSAEAVAALTRWLKSAQYWEWFQHIYALPDSRGDVRERVAVEALRTHALGLCDDYTGFGSYLKFLPPDYRRLLETDSNLVAEERLALLDVLPETPALGEPERTWYISGLMRRKGFDLIRTGSDHSDYAAIRRGIDLLLNVLESSPDDHVAAAQAVDQLVVLGETEQALQLGRRFPCDEVLPPMGLALFNAGRVEETIATLEPHVARHFDDFHTMHTDYKRALREAKAAWEKKLKGEMPSEFDQKRIVEYDHGSFLATADEWLDRLARVDSLPRKLRIRMWRAQDWRGAARLLARALAASGIAKGPEAAERVARALELQRRVCEVSPYVDEDAGVLTICEMLSAGSGIDAIRQRLELDNRGEALLQLGELLKASG
ncbi:MAG: hypothetical protein K8T20_06810, partial [Planctomycetes bacterium]|nr:hypothetical protein [Planctomycetota bacterium]